MVGELCGHGGNNNMKHTREPCLLDLNDGLWEPEHIQSESVQERLRTTPEALATFPASQRAVKVCCKIALKAKGEGFGLPHNLTSHY